MIKKRIVYFWLFLFSILLLSCNDRSYSGPPHDSAQPELVSLQLVGLGKKCQTKSNYLVINTFALKKIIDEEGFENGYYAILTIDTDLSSDKLAIPSNRDDKGIIDLWLSNTEFFKLDYYTYAETDGTLYCKFVDNNIEESKLLTLKVSDNSKIDFPFFMISFGCFFYCVVNPIQYYNVNFYIPLE